jgi:hypothetical protein
MRGDEDMEKKIFLFLSFLILLFLPSPAISDCVDLGRATSLYVQSENTIIYYGGNTPIAKIVLQDCTVNSSSNIRLTKSYRCDEDRLVIDGDECAIMTLTSASSGPL